MPIDDPTDELNEILRLCKIGKLTIKAKVFAESRLETTSDIMDTMDEMENNGHTVPTEGQEEALENIYHAAMKWLPRAPQRADPDE